MKKLIFTVIILAILASCNSIKRDYREHIDLSGTWQFALDSAREGIDRQWFTTNFSDSVLLPGTTDSNHKGFLNADTTTMHLNRVYTWEGPAWYRKKVHIPDSFKDRHIVLFLERTKPTRVWVDQNPAGGSSILETPQQYDLTDLLDPGNHFITVRVDNSLDLTPYGNVHIYSDDTQTNWNGIIGRMYLEASPKTHISNLQVFPDIGDQKIDVKLEVENGLKMDTIDIDLLVGETVDGKKRRLETKSFRLPCKPVIHLEYVLGEESDLWDEFKQPLYHLTAVISGPDLTDSKTVPFGMRSFSTRGTQFTINGRPVFLRGKHDACVFPLTGYPPMDVEGWKRVFKIARSYGINHYRFHSWCPPEAAFTAADQAGIYIQAELPFWGGLDSDTIAEMQKKEGFAMLKAYANHPSFVMFSPGNEIWSGHDRVEKNILAFKDFDNRPLYTMGSNNNIGYTGPRDCSDFYVGARTPYDHDTILTHTRLTHAFADSYHGGILNTLTPSTDVTFDWAVSHINMPVIGHETGQYQIFPDYSEIDKYTGVLRARNLEVFRDRLRKAGMAGQDSAFHIASGAWAALCYKAEMEAAFRTRGFGGFQLLDLQDFPGQGTALVGILDAFMDSKNVVSRKKWLQSCNNVVLLLEFPRYCWTNNEHFIGRVEVANYSDESLKDNIKWMIHDSEGNLLADGTLNGNSMTTGEVTRAGIINYDLSAIDKAEKISIELSLPGTTYTNSYPLWVYPSVQALPESREILIAEKPDEDVFNLLQEGGKVLLFPTTEDVKNTSVPGLFPPDFWNYGMFKSISERVGKPISPGTLGILTNPDHPLFNCFPTDFHTNWQWFSIIKASNPLILDETPEDYKPIVQVIDNLERNHKLGLIFEFRVGKGKLLVCMSQLPGITDKPEAMQLFSSMLNYMKSDSFNPEFEISPEDIKNILTR